MARPERETRAVLKHLAPSLSERDRGLALEEDAGGMLKILDRFPQRTVEFMLTSIEESLGEWNHVDLGEFLGRTPDQIERYIKKGLPWQSKAKITPRIEALFVIITKFDDYNLSTKTKRRILTKPDNVHVGGLSIVELISIGKTQIPLTLANRAIEQDIEVDEYQRHLGSDDSF